MTARVNPRGPRHRNVAMARRSTIHPRRDSGGGVGMIPLLPACLVDIGVVLSITEGLGLREEVKDFWEDRTLSRVWAKSCPISC
jgi:hypothetical protein